MFGVVCYAEKLNWHMRQEPLLSNGRYPFLHTHTHTHTKKERKREGEAGCFCLSCIQKPDSAVPNQMNGHPSTFRILPVTMGSALGSWQVFSYILWPTFCRCSHHLHQNATVRGSPSSVHIFFSRKKKKGWGEIDFHRMTPLIGRRKRSLQLRWCKRCHPGSHFVFSALISSFGADCLQWAPENWVWFTWSK